MTFHSLAAERLQSAENKIITINNLQKRMPAASSGRIFALLRAGVSAQVTAAAFPKKLSLTCK